MLALISPTKMESLGAVDDHDRLPVLQLAGLRNHPGEVVTLWA